MRTLSFLTLVALLSLGACSHHGKSCCAKKESCSREAKKSCCKKGKDKKECKDGACERKNKKEAKVEDKKKS